MLAETFDDFYEDVRFSIPYKPNPANREEFGLVSVKNNSGVTNIFLFIPVMQFENYEEYVKRYFGNELWNSNDLQYSLCEIHREIIKDNHSLYVVILTNRFTKDYYEPSMMWTDLSYSVNFQLEDAYNHRDKVFFELYKELDWKYFLNRLNYIKCL